MPAKAGGGRSQRQPSQSQAPRGTQKSAPRGGRRSQVQEEPEDEEEYGEEDDNDEAPGGSMDVDGDQVPFFLSFPPFSSPEGMKGMDGC